MFDLCTKKPKEEEVKRKQENVNWRGTYKYHMLNWPLLSPAQPLGEDRSRGLEGERLAYPAVGGSRAARNLSQEQGWLSGVLWMD